MSDPASSPAAQRRRLSVVVPCCDEEPGIDEFHRRLCESLETLTQLDLEILYVDDGSRDRTAERLLEISARDPRVGVISLSRNFGHQIALSAGLDAAQGDAVVVMDGDLQHPPALLPQFVRHWEAGADIVSGLRRHTEAAGPLKRWSSDLFYRVFNALSDVPIEPRVADFGLFSREVVNALRAMPERHRFLRAMIAWVGFRREFVEFTAPPRLAGVSKYSWRRMTALAITAVTSFSPRPLRIASRLGVAVTLLGAAYLSFILGSWIVTPDRLVPGWTSVIGVVLVVGGTQLVFLGVLGEYVARLYEEAKGRPLYLTRRNIAPRNRPLPATKAS